MKFNLCLLILLLLHHYVSTEESPKFCLCVLKSILQEYSLLTTDRLPPRYRPLNPADIGFYVVPSRWKPVNNATWSELAAMINAPTGMYSHISINRKDPLQNGLQLNSRQTAYLADIVADYQSMMYKVDLYHEKIIQNHTKSCSQEVKSNSFDSNQTFNFKHWCVYLYVECEKHERQRWTVEKEFKKDYAAQYHQCFWNNCVVMWCGHYDSFLCTERARRISNQPLNVAYNMAITWSSNGYNLMNDNCATFANDYDRRLPF
ncbi:unnamed protein product [Adineta ricciae]|uniref:Uncharacterized protein n=1 Tax=Adineta ricciae TaxID=249248 RepID=A0A814XBU1_ADIRI|nr:unnamed protein product [Adineta ricciae]